MNRKKMIFLICIWIVVIVIPNISGNSVKNIDIRDANYIQSPNDYSLDQNFIFYEGNSFNNPKLGFTVSKFPYSYFPDTGYCGATEAIDGFPYAQAVLWVHTLKEREEPGEPLTSRPYSFSSSGVNPRSFNRSLEGMIPFCCNHFALPPA